MHIVSKWTEKTYKGDKYDASPIYSLCFSPDGSQLIVGSGERILVYDPDDGRLLQALKGHRDSIYCVAYSRDGKRFSSGGADKTVILWSNKLEGVLKFTHGDAIQCMAYNPVTHQLASCAISDYSVWSPDQKAVQKYKSQSRITSCAWTNDGQYIALGLASGNVSIRNKTGEEKTRIERPGGANSGVWAVAWNPPANSSADTLVVADWGQQLSFYSLGGQALNKERALGFNPLFLTHFPAGEFLVVGGCSNSLILMTKDGARLRNLEPQNSWVWTAKVHPKQHSIIIGCQDGTISCMHLKFSVVHALYQERYAYRENMSDVIIQHLVSGQKVRIKCRDIVNKIAIYRNSLAVQLAERVVLYELFSTENQPMHYKVKEKLSKKLDCSLLVVCSKNLVLCKERRLQSLTFLGITEREWQLDSPIRYVKVTGGPPGCEGMLLGLKNGQVWRIYLDNPLPIFVTQVSSSVRCLDLSASREILAVVDDSNKLYVRDLSSDMLLYQESRVNSAAWNLEHETMLCYAGPRDMALRIRNLPPRNWMQKGSVVVGLSGPEAFCLKHNTIRHVKIPLNAAMHQFMDNEQYREAYEMACLGVGVEDWEALGAAALETLHFPIAREAFVRARNYSKLRLVHQLLDRQKNNDHIDSLRGTVLAWNGKHKMAARAFQNAGDQVRAMHMYSDLRMFDLAEEYLGNCSENDRKALIRMRAEWAHSVEEPRAAAELLLGAGENIRAVEIIAEQDWPDVLLDVGRRLDKSEKQALELIAFHLRRLKAIPLAVEIYLKLEDYTNVVRLYIETKEWDEAFKHSEKLPEIQKEVHLEHAKWLAEHDQFVEANQAFIQAGHSSEGARLLVNLESCAISEKRYRDAGYFIWLRAKHSLELARNMPEKGNQHLTEYYNLRNLAGVYYAYECIYKYLLEPFRTQPPDVLFNISRFLANQVKGQILPGISLYSIFFVLSKHARILGANKLALQVVDKLQVLRPPANLQDQSEVHLLNGRSLTGGFHDPEDLLPLCYKCSAYSPHLQGVRCNACKHEFVYSFGSFEILPLVEFFIEEGISQQEALRLIEAPIVESNDKNSMTMSTDPFGEAILQEELVLGRNALRQLDSRHVLIAPGDGPIPTKYYRNMIPGIIMTVCHSCSCVFNTDDYELQILQKGHCAFCRTAPNS